jgi:hypothetical protein
MGRHKRGSLRTVSRRTITIKEPAERQPRGAQAPCGGH